MRPNITRAFVQRHASSESFRRGGQYHRGGAVVSMTQRGDILQAEVEGREPVPYVVRVALEQNSVVEASCSCLYDWGGWCKHIVAVLLTCVDTPEMVEERPALGDSLSSLDQAQLRGLVLRLAQRAPALPDAVEREAALLQRQPSPGGEAPDATPDVIVDAIAVRRQVRAILHGLDRLPPSEAYWLVGGIIDQLRELLDQAWGLIKAGKGSAALPMLEAMTGAYVKNWTVLDDSNGEASGFFPDLGAAWAEAILSAGLDATERRSWAGKLTAWARELEEYGVEEAFDAAVAAAEQGWDGPALAQALRGESDGEEPGRRSSFYGADGLAIARLNVLQRQGRYEEYLRFARAEGLTELYTTMLVRLDRAEEAVEHGLKRLTAPEGALALAKALRQNDPVAAARVAQHGLTLTGPKGDLATWLCDFASALDQTDLALEAATVGFKEEPNLTSYARVRVLAGADWPRRSTELMDFLRQTTSPFSRGPVDVFLHEHLIDDAIARVHGSFDVALVAEVADAATRTHPNWVIQTGRQYAEEIMDQGRSTHYQNAVEWLARVQNAYHVIGQATDWQAYLDGLIARHERKYKLRPMLESLRTEAG